MMPIFCALLAAAPRPPLAESEPGAFVLRIDGRDAYFDLGRATGAALGARVKVFRQITALNPVTQAPMQDRFLVAEMEIAEAGAVLSRSRPDPEIARLIKVGDRVELLHPPPAEMPQKNAQPAAACAPAQRDPEAEGLREAFVMSQQLAAAPRASFWEKWAGEHASWPVARAVRREVEQLRQPAAQAAAAVTQAPAVPAVPEIEMPAVAAPAHALAGDPLEIVLTFADRPPTAATLNYRTRGTPLYRTVSFEADDARYWRARLPDGAVQAPGLDYYVGVIDSAGAERPVQGEGARPTSIEVTPPPGSDAPQIRQRSRASLWIDYANWNSKLSNDYHYTLEGEFLYRVLTGLHSVRMGFGVYQGRGQSLDAEKARLPVQDVGYHYGFTELEFHPGALWGFAIKGLTGVDRAGFGAGIEGRLRIGEENGTNLVLASGFTKGIGNKNEITLTWDRVRGWPMAGSVIVTNEPVMADYGVRFVYSIGKSLADFVDVSLRLSYQLRAIDHGGFGVGVANSFHW
jgi:hypothetical protein